MSPRQRVERDSLGEVLVPDNVLYGAHTVRALANFALSGTALAQNEPLLRALAEVKAACAEANAELGVMEQDVTVAIVAAAEEVIRGAWREQFPVSIIQGGGGTPTIMNVNEVLANRANEILGGKWGTYDRVHPNDHVNRSQSTNDVYPTALAIAVVRCAAECVTAFRKLAEVFLNKAHEYEGIDHLGRTCLQDALPLSIADTHVAQAHAVERVARDLESASDVLTRLPLGATAIGTGAGAPSNFGQVAVRYLGRRTGLQLGLVDDSFDALANLDGHLAVASSLERAMIVIGKIAQDLRFLSSGPIGGIGEVELPAVQVGSSVMPGKVNPVIPELVLQVSYETRGMHTTVAAAVAAGELELNVMEPVIAKNLIGSLQDCARVAILFADRCVAGLRWNREVVDQHLRGSFLPDVEASLRTGHEAAAEARLARLRADARDDRRPD